MLGIQQNVIGILTFLGLVGIVNHKSWIEKVFDYCFTRHQIHRFGSAFRGLLLDRPSL